MRGSAVRAAGGGSRDSVWVLQAGGSYSSATASAPPLPAAAPGGGGCALAGGQLLVATSTGKALAVAPISKTGADRHVHRARPAGTYGRLRTVVVGTDGALWLTTRNRDGHGKPIPDDDRVIRIRHRQFSPVSEAPLINAGH